MQSKLNKYNVKWKVINYYFNVRPCVKINMQGITKSNTK